MSRRCPQHRLEDAEDVHPVEQPDGERREDEREERVEPHHEHEDEQECDRDGNPHEWHA
jgi:hypothetical protein